MGGSGGGTRCNPALQLHRGFGVGTASLATAAEHAPWLPSEAQECLPRKAEKDAPCPESANSASLPSEDSVKGSRTLDSGVQR